MEAVIFFLFFGLYLIIRVLMGGGETAWEKSEKRHLRVLSRADFDQKEAIRYFENVLNKNPGDVFALVSIGKLYLEAELPEKALIFAQRALRLENTVAEVHLLMSRGLFGLGETDLAIIHARNALWYGRNKVEMKNWLGNILIAKGDVEQGLQVLEQAFAQTLEEENKTKSRFQLPFEKLKNKNSDQYN